jgi:outer membrane protein assembly factor BamB
MRRFTLLALLLLSVPAFGVIIRLTPMADLLKDSTFIAEATVDTLDAKRPAMMLKLGKSLKGKPEFAKMPVLINGDAGAKKRKEVPQLLERVSEKMQLVVFAVKRGKGWLGFGYTNGTWFAMSGQVVEGEVRWTFDHLEPYLQRTYKGTTAEMIKLIGDVQAGKRKPPPPDAKGKPGLGPKATKTSIEHEPYRRGLVVAPFVAGPLALLAMLFPAVFAGWERWLALLVSGCTSLTLLTVYYLFEAQLTGCWFASPVAVWAQVTLIHLVGLAWAWSRHQQRVTTGQAPLLPRQAEVIALLGLTVLGLVLVGAVQAGYLQGQNLLQQAWWPVVVFVAGLALATGYAVALRLQGPQLTPATSCESVILLGVMGASVLIGPALVKTRPAIADTEDVQLMWTFRLPSGGMISSSPLVHGARVYIAAAQGDSFSRNGALYCLDRESGEVIWSFDNDGKMKIVHSSPVIADGVLYIGEGFHDDEHCKLFALDPESGDKKGEFETGSHTEATPVVAGDAVYVGAGDDGLYRISRAGLKKAWNFAGFHIDSGPAVVDDALYVGSYVGDLFKETAVFRLDAATGKVRWRVPTDLPVATRVLASQGRVYAGLARGRSTEEPEMPAGRVLCLETEKGKPVWQRKFPQGVFTPIVADYQQVYFGTNDGVYHAVDRNDGGTIWSRKVGGKIAAGPALERPSGTEEQPSRIYIVSMDGILTAMRPESGEFIWRKALAGEHQELEVLSTPALEVEGEGEGQLVRQLYVALTIKGSGFGVGEVRCYEDRTGTK